MRILVFSTAYFPFVGGAEVAIEEISKRLPAHEWHVITARIDSKLSKTESRFGVTVHRVGFGWGRADTFLLPFLGTLKALSLHRKKRVDRIWAMMASQGGIAATFFKKLCRKIPMILTLQEGDEETYLARYVGGNQLLYKFFVRPWYRMIFRTADECTVISTYLGERARASGFSGKIELVPNGVDLARFVPGRRVFGEDGKIILIHTGRFVEKNAVDDIVEALPFLPPRVHLWAVGAGALKSTVEQQIARLGLRERVTLFPQKNHDELVALMQKADIFIRPSLSEGMGNSFVEAMAMRLPVIATRVGGIADFLFDGKTGVECKPHDPRSIVAAVVRLSEHPDERERMVAEAESMVRTKYDWKGIARKMASVFEDAKSGVKPVVIAAGIFPPDPGGPALHAKKYFEALPQLGVPTRLVAFRDYRKFPKGVRHVLFTRSLFRKSLGARAIFAHDAVSVGVPARLVSRLLRKPLYLRIGGDLAWERAAMAGKSTSSMLEWYRNGHFKKDRLHLASRKVIRAADALIVPARILKDLYVQFYGVSPEKIFVIPNPVEGEREFASETKKLILFASRMVAYKNLEFVLRVLSGMRSELAGFEFIFCGDGPLLERYRFLATELSLDGIVRFPGAVSEAQVAEYTRVCQITLAPALTEFAPNYLLRGVAAGKPFLISRENGLSETIPEEWLFDPCNAQELSEKLRCMLSDDGYREAQGKLKTLKLGPSWKELLGQVREIVARK